jgi:signal transduction histidine kinase/phage shock protein PspC (stress-responsive transcriptional regulator)
MQPSALAGTDRSRHRRLRRRPDRALIGGVCAGVAEYLQVEPTVVRLVFILIVAASGIGIVIYPLAWALIPRDETIPADGPRTWGERLENWREALAIIVAVGLAAALLRWAGVWLGDAIVLPLILASCGVALLVRRAGAAWEPGTSAGSRWRRWPEGLLGGLLVLSAAALFLHHTSAFSHWRHAAGGMLLIAVVVGLLFGPWFVRMARVLASERAARIRSQERADVAAHLHDSVLQTLALIQRRAEDSREVAGLARQQERELRRWLFERGDGPRAATLAGALEQAAAEVEDLYRVRVEVVTVGDCQLDEPLLAMVSAAREALVNAAKFAGDGEVDLFAEIADDTVQVFVRDRGAGFDLHEIPADRHGVRHSIFERMRQHGGRAEIRSAPGSGTEVELAMERVAR